MTKLDTLDLWEPVFYNTFHSNNFKIDLTTIVIGEEYNENFHLGNLISDRCGKESQNE